MVCPSHSFANARCGLSTHVHHSEVLSRTSFTRISRNKYASLAHAHRGIEITRIPFTSERRKDIVLTATQLQGDSSFEVRCKQAVFSLLLGSGLIFCGSANAALHGEPANALSVPTWIIHISSVIEWTTAMFLMWRYAEVTGNERWKGMTWGMVPLFTGALTACTYHFFYNAPELDFLVAIQAALTWIGNATLWIAAYRIYEGSKTAAEDSRAEKT